MANDMVEGKASCAGRLFLVDHMCVLPYGHNLNALVLFEDALSPCFDSSMCLVARDLPEYAEQSNRVSRELSYPYGGFVERSPPKKTSRTASLRVKLGRVVRRAVYTGIYELTGIDFIRACTRRDWKRLWNRFEICTADSLFFPSADFYGCVSLLDFVGSLPDSQRPKIHFRLIGVSENARYSRGAARPVFFDAIRKAIVGGIRLTLSAETIAYASYVERIIGTPVTYLPYPLANPPQPVNWGDSKVIASPGQGRMDKGFFRLFSIITRLEKKKFTSSFRYDVQNMRESDQYYRPRYVSILNYIPNMLLRPARLSQDEINAVYIGADILLLPYDSNTYALRGSAVYQEGLAIGRPVVCSEGLGLSDLVLRYGNGMLAGDDDDFAGKIAFLASRPKLEIEQMVVSARDAYERDFCDGIKKVIEDLTQ